MKFSQKLNGGIVLESDNKSVPHTGIVFVQYQRGAHCNQIFKYIEKI